MHRTQIYLDEVQTGQLDGRAKASGRTRSDLIREAIASYLARDDRTDAEVLARQKQALFAAFGAEPGIADAVAEVRAADRQRADELDQWWERPLS